MNNKEKTEANSKMCTKLNFFEKNKIIWRIKKTNEK